MTIISQTSQAVSEAVSGGNPGRFADPNVEAICMTAILIVAMILGARLFRDL